MWLLSLEQTGKRKEHGSQHVESGGLSHFGILVNLRIRFGVFRIVVWFRFRVCFFFFFLCTTGQKVDNALDGCLPKTVWFALILVLFCMKLLQGLCHQSVFHDCPTIVMDAMQPSKSRQCQIQELLLSSSLFSVGGSSSRESFGLDDTAPSRTKDSNHMVLSTVHHGTLFNGNLRLANRFVE